jgi:twitching motility protein PilT
LLEQYRTLQRETGPRIRAALLAVDPSLEKLMKGKNVPSPAPTPDASGQGDENPRESGVNMSAVRSILQTLWNEDKLSPEQLGLPESVVKMVLRPRGLVLVTGPTGSGKSTTLASLIDYLNMNHDHHIITIEDPIEFYHEHKKSTINQREVGVDVPSFSEAIRRALRQDPDCILVGEMRDLDTISAAISAAETGHIVFGTLHTNSAQGTVNRLIDAFPGNLQDQIRTQLSTSLLGVAAQTLIPKIGGGRCAAYEVLVVTPGIANLIRENKTFRIGSAIQTGAKFGMQLMDDSLFNLWRDGKVEIEDILSKAHRPDDLAKRIVNARRGVEDEKPADDFDHGN